MMSILITTLIIMMMVPPLLLFMNSIISKKSMKSLEKSSPFECGFDPLSLNRLPFSIQFFLITMIFLIFDIEIALLIPVIMLMYPFNLTIIILSSIFVIILIMGLYFEYMDKSIEWQK